MSGLLGRRSLLSDADLRRHSAYGNSMSGYSDLEGRRSEQANRRMTPGTESSEHLDDCDVEPDEVSPLPRSLDRPDTPPIQDETPKHRRFSMLKFRHFSEPQLATRARLQAEATVAPPVPRAPGIITTAPTMDLDAAVATKRSRLRFPGLTKTQQESKQTGPSDTSKHGKTERRKSLLLGGSSGQFKVTFDEPQGRNSQGGPLSPPAYGDESASTLALPVNRLSESSRSDASGDNGIYATTTTTHTIQTTTTFFKLPRRKKPGSLFPLPPRVIAPDNGSTLAIPTGFGSPSLGRRSRERESPAATSPRSPAVPGDGTECSLPLPSPSSAALARSSLSMAVPGSSLIRQGSDASTRSSPSRRLALRSRSSTLSSLRHASPHEPQATPNMASTRTSTSTGRKSFGDIFGLSHRLRQNSDFQFSRNASGMESPVSSASKNNSMQLSRETVVIPERLEDDTPAKYLVRLEEAVSRGVVASVLSRGSDPFTQQVLRSYMRGFSFFGDPLDMAIRKLLMEAELPKETQQIDRCLQGFANRYHECNPGIYATPEQAYFIAFSVLILHTDVFNKNNKHKMQKADYVKNTQGEGIFDEILECFYDNIAYTPFIHVEDDLDINGERIVPHRMKKKSLFPKGSSDPVKRNLREPVDPYAVILDNKLDSLKPNLKEVMYTEEHYNYLGTAASLNMRNLLDTFFKTGILQIMSARSRPDAFVSDKTITNPNEAAPGVVEIKVTKVGLLWRKDAKKKKTRSPWQEWGAILTGAQLYFFRNTAWIKNLMHQQEAHVKQGLEGIPVLFKPPLENFKPDALMSTDDAVALLDSTYKRHKNAFLFVRHGGFEETFLADNEDEMNDWMAKLNYAAAFRTAGVRMRGIIGGNYDGQRNRGIRRLGSTSGSSRSVQTPSGEVTIISSKIDNKMAQDILAARKGIMLQKISESEAKLATAEKQLEAQLRNARHLQILTPIQPKTRESVVLAAGRMAAQLKWTRMEIWRLRCHRDILVLDLEEENLVEVDSPTKTRLPPTRDSIDSKDPAQRQLKSVMSPSSFHRSPSLDPSLQATPLKETTSDTGDLFKTPPALITASSFHKAQASWELPPLDFDASSGQHASLSNTSRFGGLSHATSQRTIKQSAPSTSQSAKGAAIDEPERSLLREPFTAEQEKHPEIAIKEATPEAEDLSLTGPTEKEKLERGKMRRSLHRTLRDVHAPTHHRSKKGRDSSSGAVVVEDGKPEDILARGTGSFVVHGKKASVITFGDELSNMSTDERMRLRKQSHRESQGTTTDSTIRDEFRSVLSEPIEVREHRESAASATTTTERSFTELHDRLSAHAFAQSTRSDGDDSEAAISFSEGRRTPVPPVEDVNEDDDDISVNSTDRQAAFYTPEAVASPVLSNFDERTLRHTLSVGEPTQRGKDTETKQTANLLTSQEHDCNLSYIV